MKVYAVIKRCDNDFCHDYKVLDNRVYMKKEDAKRIWKRGTD